MTIRRADVCIIGGGLMGCFAALFLIEKGRSVVLLEKGTVGREASGVNFGNLRLQGRKPEEFSLSLLAHDLWEHFEALTGESCDYQGCGHAYLAFGSEHHPRLEQYAREANAAGIDVAVLDAGQARARWPALSDMVTGATWSPRDGIADPERACPAVARAAGQLGVEIIEGISADRITDSGGCLHVATDRGIEVVCSHVVNAAGAWSGRFARALGEPVPMFFAGPPIIETTPAPPLGLPSMLAVDGSIIFRQRPDGALITSSFPRQPSDLETGAAPIPAERMRRDLDRLADVLPALQGISPRRAWSGIEGYMPDMLPVIGESGTTAGVIHAFGFSGHGFQLAPGVGRVVCDLVVQGRSEIPVAAFSIARLRDGVTADERLGREFDPALVAAATRTNGSKDA